VTEWCMLYESQCLSGCTIENNSALLLGMEYQSVILWAPTPFTHCTTLPRPYTDCAILHVLSVHAHQASRWSLL